MDLLSSKSCEINIDDLFCDFYDKTYRLVYQVVYSIIRSEETTKDIVHDTFLTAFENFDKLETKDLDNFKPWIITIASNKAKDYLRKSKPLLFSDLVQDEDERVFDIEDTRDHLLPEELANHQELISVVDKMLDTLPEDQRFCIVLYYYQDFSVKEISEISGMNINTVKSNLAYGRNKIKRSFEKLEKNGYKLYGFAPLALLIFALQQAEKSFTLVPPVGALLGGDYVYENLESIQKDGNNNINNTNGGGHTNWRKVSRGLGISVFLVGSVLVGIDLLKSKNIISHNIEEAVPSDNKVDIFEYLLVSVEGNNKQGNLLIKKVYTEDSFINKVLESLDFSISKENELSNNEIVTIELVLKNPDIDLQDFNSSIKKYVVKDLSNRE